MRERAKILTRGKYMAYTIALFGEAEKGSFRRGYLCQDLVQLDKYFGSPPKDSKGLYCATQALLFQRHLIFFRVAEEGYSKEDYFLGLKFLQEQTVIPKVNAIWTPGVGDRELIEFIMLVCNFQQSIFITHEADFYDYLSDKKIELP